MIKGKTINELAAMITAQAAAKKDFVAPTTALEYVPEYRKQTTKELLATAFEQQMGKQPVEVPSYGALVLTAGGSDYRVQPTRHCFGQIAEHAGIPSRYAERMTTTAANRELLARNMNHWLHGEPSKRMLRTFINGEQTARAFLSSRYRPLDNSQLAEAVLPKLIETGCEIISSEITERRLYIQAATPKLELDLNALRAAGTKLSEIDPVQAGIVISNSEVGAGKIRIEPMLYRLRCLNGLIIAEAAMRKNHVGRNNAYAEMDAAAEYFTDATRELDDKVFWAKVRDVISGVLNLDGFTNLVEKFANTQAVELADAQGAVEVVVSKFKLNEDEGKSVLNHLVKGGDLSLFGLVNAVTRTAEDAVDYDRAIEFERMGGEIIELPTQIWSAN